MKTCDAIFHFIFAFICLVTAFFYCIALGIGRVVTWSWELVDQFLTETFNTELRDFFKARR